MQGCIVCKFGGSSLADADCFRRAADIISGSRLRRYVVVSAPGKCRDAGTKITDMLLAAWDKSGAERRRILDDVSERFSRIASDLGISVPECELAISDRPADRSALISRGEQLCARLFSRYTGLPCIDAAEIFIFRGGILDTETTLKNLHSLPETAVIPGFYGSDGRGGVITFPRGGSDITAAYTAAAVGAQLYENWTDVDGFFTVDPRISGNARHIDRLSWEQARLYSYMGAGVLHHAGIGSAADAGVPILVRSTFRPAACGTLICEGPGSSLPCVALKTLHDDRCLVSAMNLTPAMRRCARLILGKDSCCHSGTVCAACSAISARPLAEKLHDAVISYV